MRLHLDFGSSSCQGPGGSSWISACCSLSASIRFTFWCNWAGASGVASLRCGRLWGSRRALTSAAGLPSLVWVCCSGWLPSLGWCPDFHPELLAQLIELGFLRRRLEFHGGSDGHRGFGLHLLDAGRQGRQRGLRPLGFVTRQRLLGRRQHGFRVRSPGQGSGTVGRTSARHRVCSPPSSALGWTLVPAVPAQPCEACYHPQSRHPCWPQRHQSRQRPS